MVVEVVVVVIVLGDDGGGVVSGRVVFALERRKRVGVGQRRGICARRLLEGVYERGTWPVVAAVGSDRDVRSSRSGTSMLIARPVHRPSSSPASNDYRGRRRL